MFIATRSLHLATCSSEYVQSGNCSYVEEGLINQWMETYPVKSKFR